MNHHRRQNVREGAAAAAAPLPAHYHSSMKKPPRASERIVDECTIIPRRRRKNDNNKENNDRDGRSKRRLTSSSSDRRGLLVAKPQRLSPPDVYDSVKMRKRRRIFDDDDDSSSSSSRSPSSSSSTSPRDSIDGGETSAAAPVVHVSASPQLSSSKSAGSRVYAEFSNGQYYWGYIGEVVSMDKKRADTRYVVYFEDGDILEVKGSDLITEIHYNFIFSKYPPPPERTFEEVRGEVCRQKERADETMKRRREAKKAKTKKRTTEDGAKNKERTDAKSSLRSTASKRHNGAVVQNDCAVAGGSETTTAHPTTVDAVPRLEPERPHREEDRPAMTKGIDNPTTAGPSSGPRVPPNEKELDVEVSDTEEGRVRPEAGDGDQTRTTRPPLQEPSSGKAKQSRKRKAAAADVLRMALECRDRPPTDPARLHQSTGELAKTNFGTVGNPVHTSARKKCFANEKENARKVAANVDGDLREKYPALTPSPCRHPPQQPQRRANRTNLEQALRGVSPPPAEGECPTNEARASVSAPSSELSGWNATRPPSPPAPGDNRPGEMESARVDTERESGGKDHRFPTLPAAAPDSGGGDANRFERPQERVSYREEKRKTQRMSTRKLYKRKCGRCSQCRRDDCGHCFTCLRNARNGKDCLSKREVCLQNMCSQIPLERKAHPAEGFFEGWTFACVGPPSSCVPPTRRHRRAALIGLTLISPMGRRFKSLNHAIRCFPSGFERDEYVEPFLRHIGCCEELRKVYNV